MTLEQRINNLVHHCYWQEDLHCATTSLKVLSELFAIPLAEQLLDAATGLHGAGKYGAQCGLVEGPLMFIGVTGRQRGLTDDRITELCRQFASRFENRFVSLQCRDLRPEGFRPENLSHLCEALSCWAILFTARFILEELESGTQQFC